MKTSLLFLLLFFTIHISAATTKELELEVASAEQVFAKTMADRDFEAFASYIAEDAVFLAGNTPARGKAAVLERWKKRFEKPQPPMSWHPKTVVVLASGDLALSTGPVFNRDGKLIAYYTSTWQKQLSGQWQVVFDKGNKACPDTD